MKKLAMILAVTFTMGLAASTVSASVKDDTKKDKKETCAKTKECASKDKKACCADKKACCNKDKKACCAEKKAETPEKK